MSEGILEALLADIAGETDALCFTCRATLFREESFWVGLSAE
jgi:hypothetical protein